MPYTKTPLGQQAFKERSALLSGKQRSAFLMFDGVKTVDAILKAVAGLGVTATDVEYLLAQGFLEAGEPEPKGAPDVALPLPSAGAPVDTPDLPAPVGTPSGRTPGERYQAAYPLAVKLVSGLGLRGFRLNLAVEGVSGYDELLALLPKIQAAVGTRECAALEAALKD